MSEWQLIETAPDGGAVHFGYYGDMPVFMSRFDDEWAVVYSDTLGSWRRDEDYDTFLPSHWMPLPSKPKEVDGNVVDKIIDRFGVFGGGSFEDDQKTLRGLEEIRKKDK